MLVRHPRRQLTFATLLLAGAAGLANPVSVRGAVPAAVLERSRSRQCAGVAMTENSLKQELTMPARWKNVHDCERPSRWREQVRPLLGGGLRMHAHVHASARTRWICLGYSLCYIWLHPPLRLVTARRRGLQGPSRGARARRRVRRWAGRCCGDLLRGAFRLTLTPTDPKP